MNAWMERIGSAVHEVFESMLGARVERLDSYSLNGSDLTAIVSLAGSPSGVLGISCQSSAAAHIAMRMLGSNTPESDENAKDALGEVCNMVAGSIKSRLTPSEDRCRISIPTIISGKDYHVRPITNGERYAFCIEFEGQPVSITLQIEPPSQGYNL